MYEDAEPVEGQVSLSNNRLERLLYLLAMGDYDSIHLEGKRIPSLIFIMLCTCYLALVGASFGCSKTPHLAIVINREGRPEELPNFSINFTTSHPSSTTPNTT